MSVDPGVRPVSVIGGADGLDARYDDIVGLAQRLGSVATDLGGTAFTLHGYLLEPGLYSSGLLDPGGTAEFVERMLSALEGPRGLTSLAARCATEDLTLRAAATAYRAADELVTQAAATAHDVGRLPTALTRGASALQHGHPGQAVNAALTSDPGALDLVLPYLLPLSRPAQSLYPDGQARLAATGLDPGADATGPPRSLADLVRGLARRDDASAPQTAGGAIDVRRLVDAHGRRCYLVDIPGTKSWDRPGRHRDVTDLGTNLRAIEDQSTTYEKGVVAAMRAAGVTAADPVMLVGHSLGGMVAVHTAIACAAGRQFHVTGVVTAGSPIGLSSAHVPSSVQVLALENDGDVVPHLDGATNPPSVNVTTVTVHRNQGSIGANHSLRRSYVAGAADVDASTDPSVRQFLASAHPFVAAASVQTSTYAVTRAP